MQEVAVEAKKKAIKSDKQFTEQLHQLFLASQKQKLTVNTEVK